MRNYPRCRRAVALTVAATVTLACTAAAQAPPGTSGIRNPRLLAHANHQIRAKLPGFRPAIDGSPIIIPAGNAPTGTREGELGWALCLYNDQSYCLANTVNPGDIATAGPIRDKATSDGSDLAILEQIANGAADTITIVGAVVAGVVHRQKVYKFVKKFWFKWVRSSGKHVGFASDDGKCVGDWSYGSDIGMGSCGDAHGIYWRAEPRNSSGSAFRLLDTYKNGDMIASSPAKGTRLFIHSAEDWSTWTAIAACYIQC